MRPAIEVIVGGRGETRPSPLVLGWLGDRETGALLVDLIAAAAGGVPVEFTCIESCGGAASPAGVSCRPRPTFHWRRGGSSIIDKSPVDPNGADNVAVWSTRAVGLKGLVRASAPALDLRIIGVNRLDHTAMSEALRVARAEGRGRAAIVGDSANAGKTADTPREWLASASFSIAAEPISAARAASLIAGGEPGFDILISPAREAEIIAAFAHRLAGGGWLGVRTSYDTVDVRCAAIENVDMSGEADAGIEATINAAAEALACMGLLEAGARLRDALFRALEDNLHTDSAPLVAPYTHRLSNGAFVAAVRERIGQRPKRAAASRRLASTGAVGKSAKTSRLRLVHSS